MPFSFYLLYFSLGSTAVSTLAPQQEVPGFSLRIGRGTFLCGFGVFLRGFLRVLWSHYPALLSSIGNEWINECIFFFNILVFLLLQTMISISWLLYCKAMSWLYILMSTVCISAASSCGAFQMFFTLRNILCVLHFCFKCCWEDCLHGKKKMFLWITQSPRMQCGNVFFLFSSVSQKAQGGRHRTPLMFCSQDLFPP